MTVLNNDPQSYWNDKFSSYLHDPVDKAFMIKGHEERARLLMESFGIQPPNEDFWKEADSVASGFERGQVPSYSADENKNGAVEFFKEPIITHPVSKAGDNCHLNITLPEKILQAYKEDKVKSLCEEVRKYIIDAVGEKPSSSGYSNHDIFKRHAKTKEAANLFAQARFLYAHLVLRFKLAEDNVLGGLWHRIPADTRFPDHSIWQHNALTSALYSSSKLAGSIDNTGLMVFSIKPVQSFIEKARKLRDYWTGSVLLSWLAFEGILWVVENLGPDHIVYPSLVDQPLMNKYLEKKWDIDENECKSLNRNTDIASFPNKFVAVIPLNKLTEIKKGIEDRIRNKWAEITEKTCSYLISLIEKDAVDHEHIKTMFRRQTESYWDFNTGVSQFVDIDNIVHLKELFPESIYESNKKISSLFNAILEGTKRIKSKNKGIFYNITHRII